MAKSFCRRGVCVINHKANVLGNSQQRLYMYILHNNNNNRKYISLTWLVVMVAVW